MKPETFYYFMEQACRAAEKLGMAIVTGHTGTYQAYQPLLEYAQPTA